MDNPEPNPSVQNLRNQYITLVKSDGFTSPEAEIIVNFRFSKLENLKINNPDKLKYIINTDTVSDESIYLYLIKIFKQKIEKNSNFQYER